MQSILELWSLALLKIKRERELSIANRIVSHFLLQKQKETNGRTLKRQF